MVTEVAGCEKPASTGCESNSQHLHHQSAAVPLQCHVLLPLLHCTHVVWFSLLFAVDVLMLNCWCSEFCVEFSLHRLMCTSHSFVVLNISLETCWSFVIQIVIDVKIVCHVQSVTGTLHNHSILVKIVLLI